MTPDTYIDTLLKKYKRAPSFPYNDWVENSVSFYALINFWDELFSVAAGREKENYLAHGDAKQDPDSYIYRVVSTETAKTFSVTPQAGEEAGGMFYLITNTGEASDGSEDQYDLGFVGDLDRTRLISIFNMIRYYVSNPLESDDARKEMNTLFVESYGHAFGFPDYNPFNSPLFPIEDTDDDDD